MEDRFEVIDAFVDGERVDAAALKTALSDADGREYFVDTWLLREGMQDELALESVPQAAPPSRSKRGWPLLAVAASVSLIVGGLAGYRMAGGGRGEARPSAPNVAEAPAQGPQSFPVPPATRAIPVEFSPATPGTLGGN